VIEAELEALELVFSFLFSPSTFCNSAPRDAEGNDCLYDEETDAAEVPVVPENDEVVDNGCANEAPDLYPVECRLEEVRGD